MEGCIRFIIVTVLNSLYALLGGWMLMLAVGVAHADWLTSLPTVGYWTAALIVWLLQGAFKVVTTDELKTDKRR